jgi:hypothetical protein
MELKEAYEQKIQAQLDEISLEIDKLKAKAREAQADSKIKHSEEIKKIEDLKENVKAKLEEIKNTTNDKWEETKEELKKGMDSAWTPLAVAVNSPNKKS